MRRKKTSITLAGAMVLALLGVIPISAPAAAGGLSDCPQTREQVQNRLGGGAKSNWHIIDRSFGYVISWSLRASNDVSVKGPTKGRFEWGGRSDGSGIQYLWNNQNTSRRTMLHAGTYHCLGKRGAQNGFPLSNFPRNREMAADMFGGNPSNYARINRTGSSGWTIIANSSNSDGMVHMKTLPMGCADYATNGSADHTCKGNQPPLRDRYTLWLLARASDY